MSRMTLEGLVLRSANSVFPQISIHHLHLAWEHRAIARSTKICPCVHGDGPFLNRSWVGCVLQRCPEKNLSPDQKVQVNYTRATTYYKSTPRYHSLQAGLRVAPLIPRRILHPQHGAEYHGEREHILIFVA